MPATITRIVTEQLGDDLKQPLVIENRAGGNTIIGANAVAKAQANGYTLLSTLDMSMTYTYVPYKSSPEAMSAVASGHVDFMMLDIATGLGFIRDGKVKALAITTPERSAQLPGVPTVNEQGFPELGMSVWYAMYAPRGTPLNVVETLNASIGRVLAMPDVQDRLTQLGHDAAPSSPEELARMIQADSAKWAKAAKDGNIQLE